MIWQENSYFWLQYTPWSLSLYILKNKKVINHDGKCWHFWQEMLCYNKRRMMAIGHSNSFIFCGQFFFFPSRDYSTIVLLPSAICLLISYHHILYFACVSFLQEDNAMGVWGWSSIITLSHLLCCFCSPFVVRHGSLCALWLRDYCLRNGPSFHVLFLSFSAGMPTKAAAVFKNALIPTQ